MSTSAGRPVARRLAALSALLLLAGCGSGSPDTAPAEKSTTSTAPDASASAAHAATGGHAAPVTRVRPRPLRVGEHRVTMRMPAAYTPSAPNGVGTDDYRLVFNTGAGAGQTVFHTHLHLLAGRPMNWPPG